MGSCWSCRTGRGRSKKRCPASQSPSVPSVPTPLVMKLVTTLETTTTSTTRPTRSHTLMATISRRQRQEINYYSNPDVKFKNVATGVEGKADSARLITEHRFVIAGVGDESEKCSINVSGGAGGKTTTSPSDNLLSTCCHFDHFSTCDYDH